jgi:hypothetical protein
VRRCTSLVHLPRAVGRLINWAQWRSHPSCLALCINEGRRPTHRGPDNPMEMADETMDWNKLDMDEADGRRGKMKKSMGNDGTDSDDDNAYDKTIWMIIKRMLPPAPSAPTGRACAPKTGAGPSAVIWRDLNPSPVYGVARVPRAGCAASYLGIQQQVTLHHERRNAQLTAAIAQPLLPYSQWYCPANSRLFEHPCSLSPPSFPNCTFCIQLDERIGPLPLLQSSTPSCLPLHRT